MKGKKKIKGSHLLNFPIASLNFISLKLGKKKKKAFVVTWCLLTCNRLWALGPPYLLV